MSLIKRKTLISVCCAAVLLDCSESSLLKGCAGTESLTQVRRGNGEKRQRVSFILEEVILLKAEWIEQATKEESKRKKSELRLVV